MPVRVTVAVPEPVIVTPVPAAAVIEPEATFRVTVIAPLPASRSATARPASATLVSSLVVQPPEGRVLVGASLTAMTLIVAVATADVRPPSLTVTLIVRGVVPGLSPLLEKVMARIAAA